MAKDYFLTALNDKELKLKIREREPQTLDMAMKQAIRVEAIGKTVNGDDSFPTPTPSVKDEGRKDRRPKDREGREARLSRRVAELERKTAAVVASNPATLAEAKLVKSSSDELLEALKKQMEEFSKEMGRMRAIQTARESVNPTPSKPVEWGQCQRPYD